jgi:hypothetical protein
MNHFRLFLGLALLITVSAAFAKDISMAWFPNDPTEEVKLYRIYMTTSAAGQWQLVGQTNGTSWTTNIPPGQVWFNVTASNFWGESEMSNTLGTPAQGKKVTGVIVTKTQAGLTLSWIPNAPEEQIAFYKVYSSAASTGPWSVATQTTSTNWIYAASPGRIYFTVTATNFWGETEMSNVIGAPALPKKVNGLSFAK